MSDDADLDSIVLTLYRGPLEDFIKRRDAAAKELRADKRRDEADRIKALRKPSRTAWVLDQAVHEDPAPVEQLAAAIAGAQTAQSGADVRNALEQVRNAVRAVATAGARAGIRAGQPLEPNALMTAVHAIIGDAGAFAELRAGRLVDVPEGGGLDILTAATLAGPPAAAGAAPAAAASTTPAPDRDPAAAVRAAAQRVELQKAELLRAESSLKYAHKRVQETQQAVATAQSKLDTAEQQLERARADVRARAAELERAQQEAAAAATQLQEAEQAVAQLRARP